MDEKRSSPCAAGLIELKNALAREIQDEADSSSRYREADAKFIHYQLPGYAHILRAMAMDEQSHHLYLEQIVAELDKQCKEELDGGIGTALTPVVQSLFDRYSSGLIGPEDFETELMLRSGIAKTSKNLRIAGEVGRLMEAHADISDIKAALAKLEPDGGQSKV